MQNPAAAGPLQTPERLETRLAVVAGLYVAALVSPALTLAVAESLRLASELLALGLLGVVGILVTVVVTRLVTRRGELVAWLHSTWVGVLVPTVGILPLLGYAGDAFLSLAFFVSGLQAETAATLVGAVGFGFGLVACLLGSLLVTMGRNRLVAATVDTDEAGDVAAEWTAGWPRRARLGLLLVVFAVATPVVGLAVWRFGWQALMPLPALGVTTILVASTLAGERTYRVTPAGLEQRRETRFTVARRLTPWSDFEGFTLTDDTLVVHRRSLHLDVRSSRWDISIADSNVVAALDAHLDRRKS
ncbi:hypothetical protein [Salinirubrum litoreum]|uniref:PH domain-containing protein n=1 Tax=Salinirubrum litoreum TaxID=1126234 RepID=A0ABD5RCI0_9EURY|nr:hypothetical protein [Salinirubrum litoreum]